MRAFGIIESRKRGGVAEWPAEEIYSQACRAIKFEPALKKRIIGENAQLVPNCLFRRLLCDGTALARLEIGVRLDPRNCKATPLDRDEVLAVLLGVLSLPVRVPCQEGEKKVEIQDCSKFLAQHYLGSTTTKAGLLTGATESWWVQDGMSLMIVELARDRISSLPRGSTVVYQFINRDLDIHHLRVERRNKPVDLWILLHGNNIDPRLLRNVRINLCRLNAERECLKIALRHITRDRINIERGKGGTERLQEYLLRSVRLLSREEMYGVPQSKLLESIQELDVIVHPGERTTLLSHLHGIRKNILAGVERFTTPNISPNITSFPASHQTFIFYNDTKNIGEQNMSKNEVYFGDNASFQGNLVVAEKISNSFNKIKEATNSEEQKVKLEEVTNLVVQMCKSLPEDKAEEAARDLNNLIDEVTSKSPRRKWYELSAESLIGAAKSIGAAAVPIIDAIRSLLNSLE